MLAISARTILHAKTDIAAARPAAKQTESFTDFPRARDAARFQIKEHRGENATNAGSKLLRKSSEKNGRRLKIFRSALWGGIFASRMQLSVKP
jgi:hypothetical protein